MIRSAALSFVLILGTAAPVPAQTPVTEVAPAEAAASTAQPPKKPADKVICRREREVGSNRTVKRCFSRKDAENADEATRRFYDRMNNQSVPVAPGI